MSYYPGDDGTHQTGVSSPSSRFSDNGDGTVSDNLTGLQWTKKASTPVVDACPVGTMTWQQALELAACLNANNYLGHTDWRVPNRKELFSLVDYSQYYTALPSGHPFVDTPTDPNSPYWASTNSGAYGNAVAWLSQIKDEGGIGGDYKTNQSNYPYQVWPVRGGVVPDTDRFSWPVDYPLGVNEYQEILSGGHYGSCGDWQGEPDGCFWLSDTSTVQEQGQVWRDVQPFLKRRVSEPMTQIREELRYRS